MHEKWVFASHFLPLFKCVLHVFVCVPADVMEGKSAILLGMSQWNSNDLVEQIETLGHMEDQSHGTHTYSYIPRYNQTPVNP